MRVGYSGRSLIDKLGIKEGMAVYFRAAPAEYFDALGPLPNISVFDKLGVPIDFIHAFYTSRNELERDAEVLLGSLKKGGALWLSWPKKSSGVVTDITEQTLRDVFLSLGVVDIKVAAITETWSGLKFVYRKGT